MKINLHIERLILDGLPVGAGQGRLIQSAVETELARLLVEGGLALESQAGGALSYLRASSIQLTNNATPPRLGQQIAGAVHDAISGEATNACSAQHSETRLERG